MTRFATVQAGRACELGFVNILVAVLALGLGDLEKSVFVLRALWQVALIASHGDVAAFERIFCGCMILDGKGRRFPAIYGMAGGAFAAIGTSAELTLVGIFVAIRALRKWYLRLEVPVLVTIFASDSFVLAEQGVFRFRVVESLEPVDLFPVRGVMTGLAGLGKAALMRIRVARCAFGEREASVLHVRFHIGDRWMTLRAGGFFVSPRKGIFSFRVIKERSGLPRVRCVAPSAILAELAAVRVLVAAGAVA